MLFLPAAIVESVYFTALEQAGHTVPEVKDEVKRIIDILAPEGGFILAPCHNIQAQNPPENVIALFEAVVRFGIY